MRKRILYIILGLVIVLILHNVIDDKREEIRDEIIPLQKRFIKARSGRETTQRLLTERLKLIEGSSTIASLSRLQGLTGDMVRASGIELLSVRPNPVIKYSYHEGITLYMEARGDTGGIADFLKRLYRTDRAIFISKISINKPSIEESDELKLNLEVVGLRRL